VSPAEAAVAPPRLAVDARELRPGVRTGIGRYLLEVLRAASLDGWSCVAYGDAGARLDTPLPGVDWRVLEAPWTQWWDQVSLPRALARDSAAVFLSPYYKGPLSAPCPVVLTIHDLFFIGYPGQSRPVYDATMTAMARLYAGRAAAIVADSEYSKRSIVARLGVSAAKVNVIPVALGAEFTPAPPGQALLARYAVAPPYVLYVGNFKPHKNLARLIRAFALLPGPLRGRHSLVLAGGDVDGCAALAGLAATLGLGARVIFPGRVADEDLAALYSGAAAFVLPSLEEGFGLPVLEAMACGAPVVASNRAALPELVADAGLVFDAEREGELAAALARVLADAGLADDLRHRGLARAALYTPARTSGRVLALLRDVSAARARLGAWGTDARPRLGEPR
jgi:glycosyltransferase involved in cell wall biosynthesis